MTPEGKAYALMRLSEAPNLTALRRVWKGLSREYQECAEIAAHKEAMKKALEDSNAAPETPGI